VNGNNVALGVDLGESIPYRLRTRRSACDDLSQFGERWAAGDALKMLAPRVTEQQNDLTDGVTGLKLLQRVDDDGLARKVGELFWDFAAKA
jgi:hypothetical protein